MTVKLWIREGENICEYGNSEKYHFRQSSFCSCYVEMYIGVLYFSCFGLYIYNIVTIELPVKLPKSTRKTRRILVSVTHSYSRCYMINLVLNVVMESISPRRVWKKVEFWGCVKCPYTYCNCRSESCLCLLIYITNHVVPIYGSRDLQMVKKLALPIGTRTHSVYT